MQAINKARFYEIIGKLNVHPCPTGKWDNGYLTHWKLPDGIVVGVSHGSGTQPGQWYTIAERFLK
jgi:hypothetical protein